MTDLPPTGNTHDRASAHRWLLPCLVALVVLLLGIICYLVMQRNAYPPPPHPAMEKPPKHLKPPVEKTVIGTVAGYAANTHLDVHALRLRSHENGELSFDFRPHTARAVMDIAGRDDSVQVSYTCDPDDEAIGYRLTSVKNLHSRKVLNLNELPPPPRVPPGVAPETFVIKDPVLILDTYGGVAAIKSGNRLFHFKPEHVENILGLIKSSKELTLLAVPRDAQFGFVNIEHDQVYIVISITIHHQTFLIR